MDWPLKSDLLSHENPPPVGEIPLPPVEAKPLAMPAQFWHFGLMALAGGLIMLLLYSYEVAFFKDNLASAAEFLLSGPFLFLCLASLCLAAKRLNTRGYELCVFVLAAAYLYLWYGEYLLLLHMSGDSVCQVAYWNILFRPQLSGSIGVAFAKPGQVLLLGVLYQLSLLGGHIVFKIGLCLVMAACVWSLVGVAREVGGRMAGLLAFFLSLWAFQEDFVSSESTIYAICTLFAGLRFYCYHPRLKGLGRLLLVLTLQFRIEAVAVLGVIWLWTLCRRDWRELLIFSGWALLSLLLFVGLIMQIQGSFARLNSGAAVGYVGPPLGYGDGSGDPFFGNPKVEYIIGTIRDEFAGTYHIRLLFMLAVVGIAGAFCFHYKRYLMVFASMIIITANVFLLGGSFNLQRYCDLIYAFSCSLGAVAVIRYGQFVLQKRTVLRLGTVAIAAVALLAAFDFSRLNTYKHLNPSSFSEFLFNAMALLQDEKLPFTTRLMTEDDILSHVVVMEPDRYKTLTSLQYFNVADEAERREILSKTDYIWLDLYNFPFYYLYHLARPEWQQDPFRLMVQAILAEGRQTRTLYGYQFVPVDLDPNRLILEVLH